MLERVLDLVATVLDVPRVDLGRDSDAGNVKGWDSTAQLNLGVAIEEEFRIELAPEELTGLQSVVQILAILEAHGIAP